VEIEELIKNVDTELQWLKYYALAEVDQSIYPGMNGRKTFDPTRSPYDQLVSIGYTKRVIPLSMRCVFLRLTAETPVKDTPLEQLTSSNEGRNPEKNIYSALEVLLMKYPEKHEWVFNSLQ
jgi:hypothetical protein